MKKQKIDVTRLPIEKICPPPILETLLLLQKPSKLPDDVNPAKKFLINLVQEDWAIICWWIMYERCPGIDIRYHPYSTPDFRAKRSLAQLLDKQMDVCKGVFEDEGSPLQYWLHLMQERKKVDIDVVFVQSEPKFAVRLTRGDQKIRQPGYLDHCRFLLKNLRDERVVPDNLQEYPAHYRFLKKSLRLAWQQPHSSNCKKFRELYWNPFLAALNYYIQDVEGRTELGIVNEWDGKLYQNVRGKSKALKMAGTD